MEAMVEAEGIPFGAPPLTQREKDALVCMEAARGDWGPVFVYGSMLFPGAWAGLIDRIPEMRCATLLGYERRAFTTGGFAGIFQPEEEGKKVVGMLVTGLLPKERYLLDAVVDDSFLMVDVSVEPTGDAEPRLTITQCGDPEFNGRYEPVGMKEGRPCYKKETPGRNGLHKTIHFGDGCWRFGVDYVGNFYKCQVTTLKPPLDGWEMEADGLTPLPVITKEVMTTECTTYVMRDSCLDAMADTDWDFEAFGETWLDGFISLCADTKVRLGDEKLSDDVLKDLALARRRRETGFEEEAEQARPDLEVAAEDPDGVDSRLEVNFVRGIIRAEAALAEEHLRDERWPKAVEVDEVTGRTPDQERKRLESEEKALLSAKRRRLGPKWPHEVSQREAGNLLEKLRSGEIRLYGEGAVPFAVSGLPPTKGADFVVASAPTDSFAWYARACIICANFRIGWCEVSIPHFEDLWFYVWKRNVDHAVQENKTLIVLTKTETYGTREEHKGAGNLNFVQSVQLQHLQMKGYRYQAVDITDFCRDLQPVLSAAMENDFDRMEQNLMNRREIPVPITNVFDHTGRSAMHYAARLGPSERAFRLLLDQGESVNAIQWGCDEWGAGWTPLMHAAKFGPPRMIRTLFEAGADAHVKNQANETVFQVVKERPQNERMLSQCHFRSCKTCQKGEGGTDLKPPSTASGRPPSQAGHVHTEGCTICSRFL